MKHSVNLPALLFCLLLVLCPLFAACGGTVVGDDWRVSGVVVGSGTVTHDGVGVPVLVTVDADSAAFYWDKKEQVLFDSVAFPVTVEDAETAFVGIDFGDLNGDGESDVTVDFHHADGTVTHLVWIWDADARYVFREELSYFAAGAYGDAYIDLYVGLWEYVGENLWLRIEADASWEFLDANGDTVLSGTAVAEPEAINLIEDESGDVLRLVRNDDELYDSANDGWLQPAEAIEAAVPVFEASRLAAELLAPDSGMHLLEGGVCSYTGLGDGYNIADCYWEVILRGDNTHDGIRELEFDAVCYIPKSSIPAFEESYITTTASELYDYYTGMWLTAQTAYNETARGENHYLHTVEWNGENYDIEFFFSTAWQDNVGAFAKVLTKSYVVYLPADYDGLVLAAEKMPDDYRSCAARDQLDSISPEACITDIDLLDIYSAIYFAVCQ